MFKRLSLLIAGAALALAMPVMAEAKTFYWISHGSPADPVWTYFLAGAEQWAKDTGNTVNTSGTGFTKVQGSSFSYMPAELSPASQFLLRVSPSTGGRM